MSFTRSPILLPLFRRSARMLDTFSPGTQLRRATWPFSRQNAARTSSCQRNAPLNASLLRMSMCCKFQRIRTDCRAKRTLLLDYGCTMHQSVQGSRAPFCAPRKTHTSPRPRLYHAPVRPGFQSTMLRPPPLFQASPHALLGYQGRLNPNRSNPVLSSNRKARISIIPARGLNTWIPSETTGRFQIRST